MPHSRGVLRRALRARRDALPLPERRAAARAVASFVARTRWLRAGRPIGLYLSIGSELDTGPLLALARRRGCPVYLPRIIDYRRRHMLLVRAAARGRRRLNRYRIPEPVSHESSPPRALAVVFVPLLGVDSRGTRLGYGGGYYDRLLAARPRHALIRAPLLVGLAYESQRLMQIEAAAHDIPLDALVTEAGVTFFHHPDRTS